MARLPAMLVAVALLVVGVTDGTRAQEPSIALVLERAGAYVAAWQHDRSGMVAEESYVQDFSTSSTTLTFAQMRPVAHRELKSDLLLVQLASGGQYVEFRDVFEVDGRAVRDRQDRLTQLFLEGSPTATSQLARIVADSARYNIGSIQRTLNTPTLPLLFLSTENQPRLAFKHAARGEAALARSSDTVTRPRAPMPANAWIVEYQEPSRNTLIRTANNRDLPSHGRFWMNPETGHVLMSELIAEDATVRGLIDVWYDLEPTVGTLVPVEMRERYEGRNGQLVEGRATYARFRRFQVQVGTDIADPPRR